MSSYYTSFFNYLANSERLREGSSREERANGWSVELGTKNELHVNSKSEDPQSRIVATEERLRQQENEDEVGVIF